MSSACSVMVMLSWTPDRSISAWYMTNPRFFAVRSVPVKFCVGVAKKKKGVRCHQGRALCSEISKRK